MIRYLTATLILGFAGLAFASPVSAYSQQTTGGSAGKTLRWRSNEITVFINEPNLDKVSNREFADLVRESFSKWSKQTGISFRFEFTDRASISSRKSGGDGISVVTIAPTAANMLLFDEHKANASAVTRLFFDSTGNIREADIVLNPSASFTRDGSRGTFDLNATLTHEAGHFLGLGHSKVVGSTMHRHQGRNGTFALPAAYPITLSEDDKAGIRSLYGTSSALPESFGSIRGIVNHKYLSAEGTHVWLESARTGSVIAGIEVNKDGEFLMSSVPGGNYRVIASNLDSGFLPVFADSIRIEGGAEEFVELSPDEGLIETGPTGVGFNSQISNLAIPLETGHSFTVYIRRANLDPERFRIECSSPGISVDSRSLAMQYSRDGLDVLSFEVFVSRSVGKGDYSLRLFDDGVLTDYLPGVITVDDVSNPWYSSLF